MKKKTSAKMIKKAIDSYPGGICFSALDGRVILVNEKMNQLMLELTGHTILNAKVAWEELANFANNGKAEKLNQSWLPKDPDNENGSTHQQLFFRFSDSSVWRFELRFLDSNTVQIEAAEITELYRLSEELYENTIRLQDMQKRQKALLDSIVEVNLNKEILTAKMPRKCISMMSWVIVFWPPLRQLRKTVWLRMPTHCGKAGTVPFRIFPIFLPCGRFPIPLCSPN